MIETARAALDGLSVGYTVDCLAASFSKLTPQLKIGAAAMRAFAYAYGAGRFLKRQPAPASRRGSMRQRARTIKRMRR